MIWFNCKNSEPIRSPLGKIMISLRKSSNSKKSARKKQVWADTQNSRRTMEEWLFQRIHRSYKFKPILTLRILDKIGGILKFIQLIQISWLEFGIVHTRQIKVQHLTVWSKDSLQARKITRNQKKQNLEIANSRYYLRLARDMINWWMKLINLRICILGVLLKWEHYREILRLLWLDNKMTVKPLKPYVLKMIKMSKRKSSRYVTMQESYRLTISIQETSWCRWQINKISNKYVHSISSTNIKSSSSPPALTVQLCFSSNQIWKTRKKQFRDRI